ncbi:uncharacterized protein METZ01_LOCUS275720, partial [marine metagenome]
AWGFQPEYITLELEVLPVYAFEVLAPISDKAVKKDELCCDEEWTYTFGIWATNLGNIEDSYEINVTLNDTVNFSIIDFDSIVHAEFDETVTINLTIMLNASSVTEFSVGELNVSVTSMNSTDVLGSWTVVKARLYVPPDTLPPSTYAQASSLVNSSSFEVKWYVEDWYNEHELGNDTKYFIIEYMTDNGTYGQTWGEWEVWGNFTSDQESGLFTYGIDGHGYRFRSIGGDDDGRVENKEDNYDTETLVDLSAPNLTMILKMDGNITNIDYIEIEWDVSGQNIIVTGYTAQYRLDGGNWTTFKEDTLWKSAGLHTILDGIYEFRVLASDMAGNKGISETSRNITVDTKAPTTTLIDLPEFTDAEQIEINLTQIEDTVRFALYYSVVKEGQETSPIEWDFYHPTSADYLITDLPILVDVTKQ